MAQARHPIFGEYEVHINKVDFSAPIAPHSHPFIEIAYIAGGEGVHNIAGMRYEIRQGDLFVINFDTSHEYIPAPGAHLLVYNCIFTPGFLNESLGRCHGFADLGDLFGGQGGQELSTLINIKLTQLDYLQSLFEKMHIEFQGRSRGYALLLRAYITELLVLILRNLDRGGQAGADLSGALSFINDNFTKKITLQDLSAMSYMSISRFCRAFKEKTGKTVVEYIQTLRVALAKSLLAQGAPPGEAMARCGYEDAKHFGAIFKRETGQTPSQYRKSIKD